MKKILLFGSSGAGKSTLADKLGKQLGVPVLHLDIISHDQHWNRLSPEVVEPQIEAFIAQESWVIDGHYTRYAYKQRLETADTILFLDIPTLTSFYRCVRRKLRIDSGKEKRYGADDQQPSALRLRFIHFILWRYPRQIRKPALQLLQEQYAEKLIILRTPRDIEAIAKQLVQQ